MVDRSPTPQGERFVSNTRYSSAWIPASTKLILFSIVEWQSNGAVPSLTQVQGFANQTSDCRSVKVRLDPALPPTYVLP
jgi:hypothetical protein